MAVEKYEPPELTRKIEEAVYAIAKENFAKMMKLRRENRLDIDELGAMLGYQDKMLKSLYLKQDGREP